MMTKWWKFLHYVALGYPNSPTDEQKKNLQFIVKEVVMPFTADKGLLSKIDILDFPGARSLGGAENHNITDEGFQGMYKRGKIKHFFDSYVESYDIEHIDISSLTFLNLSIFLVNSE